jgi:glycerate dehydrogenase
MTHKIVFVDAGTLFNVSNIQTLAQFGDLELHHHTDSSQTLERVKYADIIITNKVLIDKQIMDNCPKLKLICVAATGTNNIDKECAASKNITVVNATDYSTHSVAQVTFTMILYLLNQPKYYDEYVKSGKYADNEFFTHVAKPYWQLNGKKLGIVGLGNIGKQVAKIAEAFGMEILYHSFSGNNNHERYKKLALNELMIEADIVSIHTPLTELSKNCIHYDNLKLMKKHALLINVSRGGVVVEKDLAKALNENFIFGAGLDVFEKEPIERNNPVFEVKDRSKLILAPHVAWASIEARELLVKKIADNIKQFLNK